jgi:GTPase SAR1 family protein
MAALHVGNNNNLVTKTILLLGKSGSGKTTFLNMLDNPEEPTRLKDGLADTANTSLEEVTVHLPDCIFNIKIIDTPGLFETRARDEKSRTDKQILENIAKGAEEEAVRIDAFFVFHRAGTQLDSANVDAFDKLTRFLGEASRPNSYLIITETELTSDGQKRIIFDNIVQKFASESWLKFFKSSVDQRETDNTKCYRVLFSGANNLTIHDRGNDDMKALLMEDVRSTRDRFVRILNELVNPIAVPKDQFKSAIDSLNSNVAQEPERGTCRNS